MLIHYGRSDGRTWVSAEHRGGETGTDTFVVALDRDDYSNLNRYLGREGMLYERLRWNAYRVWCLEQSLLQQRPVDPLGDVDLPPQRIVDWLLAQTERFSPSVSAPLGILLDTPLTI